MLNNFTFRCTCNNCGQSCDDTSGQDGFQHKPGVSLSTTLATDNPTVYKGALGLQNPAISDICRLLNTDTQLLLIWELSWLYILSGASPFYSFIEIIILYYHRLQNNLNQHLEINGSTCNGCNSSGLRFPHTAPT